MKKALLAGATALTIAAGLAGTANAQCAWNGYSWNCGTAPAQPNYMQPSAAAPQYPYYSPVPNGSTSNPEITGYKPAWEPSLAGPKASGGAGR